MPETLAAALAQFQRELPAVIKTENATIPTKTGGSFKYTYADLAQVNRTVLPLLGALGLSFMAKPTINAEGKFVLAYKLLHSPSGDAECGEYPLPQSATSQDLGSAITYARRYALCSVVGVAPDADDDGQAGSSTRTIASQPKSSEYDPIEQEVLLAGWGAEIADADTADALKLIGKKILAAKQSGELSPASYDKLAILGGSRAAELRGQA